MFSTFSVSQTGLNASRQAIENVSNNQANKNTPGYKKRVAELSEIGIYGVHINGRGVDYEGVSRVTSQYMYDKFMQEGMKSNYYNKLSNMLGGIEAIFKETEDSLGNKGSGFSADLDRYFQSVESLRTNPHSEVYRSYMKSQGSVLVDTLQNLYKSVQKQQEIERTELDTDVKKVNSILQEIADINVKIEKYDPAINDLLDKRDLLELELSKFADLEINRDKNFYEIKIGGVVAVSNDIFEHKVEIDDKKTPQVDKFNHIKYEADGSFRVFDSLKYNEDFTKKDLYDTDDVITYKLNNEFSVSVKIGETLTGDWDNDPDTPEETKIVDNDNLTRAFMVKINANEDLNKHIVAYNGEYTVNEQGKKVLMYPNSDNYLRIESILPGKEQDFVGRFNIERKNGANVTAREVIYKNEEESKKAQSDVVLRIFEQDIELKSGSLKAQVENMSSSDTNNKFQKYLDMLDNFAQTLANVTSSYIRVGEKDYVYGREASEARNEAPFPQDGGHIVNLDIFSGASVKTLKFHKNAVNDLKQENLDYLASIQWKKDLSFIGKAQSPDDKNATSLIEYFRHTRVEVSNDKENAKYSFEVQDTITTNLGNSYNDVVKVNPDNEMIDLMKFQAAFSANAKVITAVDEMVQVLLGMKR